MRRDRKKMFTALAFPFWIAYLAYRGIENSIDSVFMLKFPFLTPSRFVFLFFTFIFLLSLGIACHRIWSAVTTYERKRVALFWYCIQMGAMFLWCIIFAELQEYCFACFCGIALCALTFFNWKRFRNIDYISGILMLSCFAWIAFCVYLNFGVWILNRY